MKMLIANFILISILSRSNGFTLSNRVPIRKLVGSNEHNSVIHTGQVLCCKAKTEKSKEILSLLLSKTNQIERNKESQVQTVLDDARQNEACISFWIRTFMKQKVGQELASQLNHVEIQIVILYFHTDMNVSDVRKSLLKKGIDYTEEDVLTVIKKISSYVLDKVDKKFNHSF